MMNRYKVTFTMYLDNTALYTAEDDADDQGKLQPMWVAGKAAEKVLRKKYGIKAKLAEWRYTGAPND
jgi:hypothetical protein